MKLSAITGFVVAGAVAFALTGQAQEGKAPEGKEGKKGPPKEHTMTGCLKKGAAENSFLVESTAEKGPKTIGIITSKDNLAPHVGHKIDITGMAVPVKDAETMKPAPPKAEHYMNLTAIKMVSATCP